MSLFAHGQYANQHDKMTQQPIPSLVLELGLPTTISMLVTNVYNVVDTAFVGQINTSASGATGVVFGLMAILQAVGFMFGHGSGSIISRQLGAERPYRARQLSATAFYSSLLAGTVIGALGLVFLTPLCNLLGSTETILPYARTYAMYILLAAPAMVTSCVMNNILRYEGHAAFAMVGLVTGGVLNIFGDALFIFGMDMGIGGAGLSTMLSQYISAVILLIPFLTGKTQTSFAPRYFPGRQGAMTPEEAAEQKEFHQKRPGTAMLCGMLVEILTTGFPSLVRQGMGSISTMMLNVQAGVYGDAAIAAMSIVARVCNFLFCVGLGIGQGFQPVSGFNYGAKLYSRVRSAFYFTLALGSAMMLVFAIGGSLLAEPVIAFMRDDPEVIAIGIPAMYLQCAALVTMPLTVSATMLFQSIGFSGRASLLSAMRSGVCFIPLLLILAKLFGLTGILWAQPAADVLSAVVSIPFIVAFFWKLPADGN